MTSAPERSESAADAKLVSYLRRVTTELERTQKRLRAAEQRSSEPIAIVGMSCRFPGGIDSPEALWEVVEQERDVITEFPDDRGWPLEEIYDPAPESVGTSYTRHGGFITDAAVFDADFFGMGPREATATDPQQRLLLESTWRAIEDAGIAPSSLAGRPVGIYIGLMAQEYATAVAAHPAEFGGMWGIGNAPSVASGRLAYVLGTTGPTVTLDTACSSSLVGVDLAVRALRSGECESALVGAATVMATPSIFVEFSRQRGCSPDGLCRAFAESADGTGWSEGVGVLMLMRESVARERGHHIWGMIRGTAVNQDGASNGLTAPSAVAQQSLIARALAEAKVSAADIGVVEAHGTGTRLGDPIEASALALTYGAARSSADPLYLGSVKSNLGHTQAAAGLAGLIKMIMAARHRRMPRTLHVDRRSSLVDWTGIELLTSARDWDAERLLFGVSAFGISGTNCHVICEGLPSAQTQPEHPTTDDAHGPVVCLLSGADRDAVQRQARRLRTHVLDDAALRLDEVEAALATGRSHLDWRAGVVVDSRSELLDRLSDIESGDAAAGTVERRRPSTPTAMMFTGQGAVAPGVGGGLTGRRFAVYRDTVAQVGAEFAAHLPMPLAERIVSGSLTASELESAQVAQSVLFAVEVGIFAQLESWGVRPDYLIGHSLGELTAAHLAGVFSLPDVCRVIAARGRLMDALPVRGAMCAIAASADDVADSLPAGVSIAAHNGPNSVVVAGDRSGVLATEERWRRRGRATRNLSVAHAFHTALVDPMLAEFGGVLRSVALRPPTASLVSTVTGLPIADSDAVDPAYWVRHTRHAVHFYQGVRWLTARGVRRFVEVGPASALVPMVQEAFLDHADSPSTIAAVCGDARSSARSILGAASALHTSGVTIDWPEVTLLPHARSARVPTYAFSGVQRFWVAPQQAVVGDVPQFAPSVGDSAEASAAQRSRTLDPNAGDDELARQVHTLVTAELATILGHPSSHSFDPDVAITDLGLASMGMVTLHRHLAEAAGSDLPIRFLLDNPTPRAIGAELASIVRSGPGIVGTDPATPAVSAPGAETPEPLAGPGPSGRSGGAGTFVGMLSVAMGSGALGEAVGALSTLAGFRAGPVSEAMADRLVSLASGPPGVAFVCVPSFLAGSGPHQFLRLAASLRNHGRVHGLILPGFGTAEPVPETWSAAVTASARAIVAATDGDEVVLLGHSAGGVVAAGIAAEVERLGGAVPRTVLLDTFAPTDGQMRQTFDWAMRHIIDNDPTGVIVTDSTILSMCGYLRLLRSSDDLAGIAGPPAGALGLRAGSTDPVGADARWQHWSCDVTVDIPEADHFSILDHHTHTVAAHVDSWTARRDHDPRASSDPGRQPVKEATSDR